MDEIALVKGCVKGDNSARRQLYERYAPGMMATCFRYVGDESVAEDILHDGFIKVFESISSFQYRGKGSLRAWMNKIFVHLALQHIKEQAIWEPLLTESIEEEELDEKGLEAVPNEVLLNFIAELPPGYRTVFNQYVFEEKSHKEIARSLGINESSSRSQLARAKAILANKIITFTEQYAQ